MPPISFIRCHFPKLSPCRLCSLILVLLCASSPHPHPKLPSDALPLSNSLCALWMPGSMTNKHIPVVTTQRILFTSSFHRACGSHLTTRMLWAFQVEGVNPPASHITQGQERPGVLLLPNCCFQTVTSPPTCIINPFGSSMPPSRLP